MNFPFRACVLLPCLALVACVTQPTKEAVPTAAPEPYAPPPAPVEVPKPPPPAPKIVTPAQQQEAQRVALKVADILAEGNVEEAQVEIERALALDPENKLALSFLRQLSADPIKELGSEHFAYTVKPGETLSKIAGRFMGDIFQFYILARYNDIAVPRRVPAGQTIRVPGKAPAEATGAVQAKPALPSKPEPPAARAEPAVKPEPIAKPEPKAKPEPAAKPEPVRPVAPPKAEPTAQPAAAPRSEPVALPPAKPEPIAKPVVEPKPTAPQPTLAPGAPPVPSAADRAFQRGLSEQARGNNFKAYEAFKESYALDSSFREAKSNADLMHQEIIADYTRQARAAFARQDLKGSIEQWDLLLKFDPGNEIAQLERQKALDLQQRIKSIK